ncbi:MAG: NAD(P)-binding protein [Caldilineae bacterium]|nr:NAD(P)-binding protein [Caldilineae bacterium]
MRNDRVHYDQVIVGAGISGLTLAHHLADVLAPEQRILLLDKDDDPDYNISFWLDGEAPFAPIMAGSWRRIELRHGQRRTVCPLERYALHAFWRDDFDAYLHAELGAHPNVDLLEAEVLAVEDHGDHAEIETREGRVHADWVFDSRSSLDGIRDADPDLLLMQGLALEIEAETACFDPELATLFDFLLDSPQFDFMYLLPYTERRALVNAAFVTPFATRVSREHCAEVIDRYLADRFGCSRYRVTRQSFGRLPLASRFPERRPGSRVLPIGVRSGMIKASTSYAFTRILADSRRIAASMAKTGQPYYRARTAWYYRAADRRSARIFQRSPALAQELMFGMFTPERGDLALAFLDERNDLAENRRLFEAVPPETLKRFLRQLLGLGGGAPVASERTA